MKKAVIIIVNWDGEKFLKTCFEALDKQTFKDFEVFFVDNGSEDDSVEFVQKNYPQTKIIEVGYNSGFAKGNNFGIKKALDENFDYIVCLNNDTKAEPQWLENLIKRAEEEKEIGVVNSKIIFGNPPVIQTTGMFSTNDLAYTHFGLGEKKESYQKSFEILCPCGASFLIKREVVEKVGMFDEDFFAYGEDVDLGIRVRLFGWKIVYEPESVVYHYHSQTKGAMSPFKTFYVTRNMLLIGFKYFSSSYFLKKISKLYKRYLLYLRAKKGDGKESSQKKGSKLKLIITVLRAYCSAFYHFPKMIRKRKQIFSNSGRTSKDAKKILEKFKLSSNKYTKKYIEGL